MANISMNDYSAGESPSHLDWNSIKSGVVDGELTITTAEPTSGSHAATKNYVDTNTVTNPLGADLDISTFTIVGYTANRALVTDASGNIIISAVTDTEIGYLDTVSSNIQTQLDAKAVDGANTDITSLANTSLTIGRDADNDIDFATDNKIIFRTNGTDGMELQSTGEMDMGANSIGFTQQTATGDGTTTIDWKDGNKFYFTFGAFSETFTFTAPSNPCNVVLVMKQDGTGSRTATWPATVDWPSGTAPTLTTDASGVDIVSFYWDGTSYFGIWTGDFS